jgi:hypothetical protein
VESLSEAIVDPGRRRAFHGLSRVISRDFFGSLGVTPVGYALAAGVSGLYSPSQILVAGFGVSTVLWLAPLTIERAPNAA